MEGTRRLLEFFRMRPYPVATRRKPRGPLRCNTGSAVRFFNTEGPIVPGDHYHIAPLSRIDLEQTLLRIQRKKYFILLALPARREKPPCCSRWHATSTPQAGFVAST